MEVAEQMKGTWQNVPGKWVEDTTAIDGRRFVASEHGVRILRARMAQDAHGRCELCGGMGIDRHHVYGRGGGKKEDRPIVNGIRFFSGYVGVAMTNRLLSLGVRGAIWKFLGLLDQVSQVKNHSIQQGFPNAASQQ